MRSTILTDNLLAMRIPIEAVRRSDITDLMYDNLYVTSDGARFIQVHPTFLYESLWCLMVLIIMILYTKHRKFDGEVFLLYLLGYGAGRVWIEGLRTDQLLIPVVGLPVSQLLAGVLIVGSLAAIIVIRIRLKNK